MSTWLVSPGELTNDQARAVERGTREPFVLFGGPGSGKTQVLIHRAGHVRDRLGLAQDRILILVYTNVLKEYIASALDLLRIPRGCVQTFHSWCMQFYETHINRKVPWVLRRPDFEAILQGVYEAVQSRPGAFRQYGCVLVDEGQDLDPRSFEVLMAVADHVTVGIDHKQQIYEGGSGEAEILTALGLRRRNAALLDTYRCSPYVVDAAACLLNPEEAEQLRMGTRTAGRRRRLCSTSRTTSRTSGHV